MRISLPFFDGNAACAETDPEAFFPEKGGATRAAKAICGGCEVRAACLQWSLDNREPGGMWGGVSENQRRELLKGGKTGRPSEPIKHGTEGGYKAHRLRGVPIPADDPCGCSAASRLAGQRRRDRRAS